MRKFLLLLFFLPVVASAQLQLLKDINTVTTGAEGNPQALTLFKGSMYFVGTNHLGSELWKTDGTANGTFMVKDIKYGTGSGLSGSSTVFAILGDYLYFTADDGINGTELWRSDGTTIGTVIVSDIYSGSTGSNPSKYTVMNNVLYFTASTAAEGNELWKYNGVSAPSLVYDIAAGTGSSSIFYLTVMNNVLYFQASNGTTAGQTPAQIGTELWKYDGTNQPTPVADILVGTGSSSPSYLTVMNNVLYFQASNGTTLAQTPAQLGTELWKYDGTNAPSLVYDIRPTTTTVNGSAPSNFTVMNNILYFTANNSSTTTSNIELWKYDGTNTPTLVYDNNGTASSSPSYLLAYNNVLYFSATTTSNGSELWVYDPASGFDPFVIDINPGTTGSISGNPYLTAYNNSIYLQAQTATGSYELFKANYDPLTFAVSSTLVKDINTAANGASYPKNFTILNGKLYFNANDAEGGLPNAELWVSDGTDTGTLKVKDLYPGGSSGPQYFEISNGNLFFTASNGSNGSELWKTDGTDAGTVMVSDINITTNNGGGSSPYYLTDINGTLFFAATNGNDGNELFTSGTGGTSMVKNLYVGTMANNSAFDAFNLSKIPVKFGSNLYFNAVIGAGEYELMKSDGTDAGTTVVSAFANSNVSIRSITIAGDILFYSANETGQGYELWYYDGTTHGMVPSANSTVTGNSISSASNVPLVVKYNNEYYFTSSTNGTNYELFKTTGPTVAPALVKEINPTATASSPKEFIELNGKLIFIANDGTTGNEIWSTDGTSANTSLVKDIYPGTTASTTIVGVFNKISSTTLLFFANDGINGIELWKTDGTNAGTVMVKDITPGTLSTNFLGKAVIEGGKLYFVANEDLWVSDGTELGTYCVGHISDGAFGSSSIPPFNIIAAFNGSIYVQGISASGIELYKYTPINVNRPATQASAITFSNKTDKSVTVSWTNGDGAKRAVFVRLGTSVPNRVNDAYTYASSADFSTKGTELYPYANYYCIYNGTGSSVELTGLLSNNQYTVYVFEYNGVAGTELYNNNISVGNSGSVTTKTPQTITFDALSSKTFGDATFELNGTASSALAVTYISSVPAVATISGTTVTIVGAGTTNIIASQIGNDSYTAAADVTQILNVSKADQTITFGALTAKTFGDGTFDLTATASSALVISYTTSDPMVATITGNIVTIVGTGTTTITAIQEGNTNYNTAVSVPQTLTINKADQSITFGALVAKTFGDAAFDLTSTASSTLPITYISSDPTVASIIGNTVTIVGVGTTTITASQAGNTNYNAAVSVPQSLIVNKADQTITFGALTTKTFGNAVFDLTANASSTLAVTYTSSDPAVASIIGNTVTIVGVGTTTITASQAGNSNYNAALSVTQTLTVSKADQTITFGALTAKTFGNAAFDLNATASSSLAVAFASSDPAVATISGNTVTIIGAGTTTITASQGGNANYNSAANVPQLLTVNKAAQTITFGTLAPKTVGNAAFDLTATASSGLAVVYASSNTAVATISGTTVTIIGSGTTTITASQTGNINYNAATSVDQVLTVSPNTGIDNLSLNNIKVYPIPAKDFITIDLGTQINNSHKLKFINIIGVVIKESLLTNSVQQIEINDLRPGVYFVVIELDNSILTKRIIVE